MCCGLEPVIGESKLCSVKRRSPIVHTQGRDYKLTALLRPLVSGWENLNRLVRPDFMPGFLKMFEDGESRVSQGNSAKLNVVLDRHARAQGKEPGKVPVVDEDPQKPSALPTPDSFKFFSAWEKKSSWKNEVTIRR